jgi:hypothetical protein
MTAVGVLLVLAPLALVPVAIAAPPAKAPVAKMPAAKAAAATVFTVRQPTIIAFFSLKGDDLKDPDTHASYADFQHYVMSAKKQLGGRGVRVEQVYATTFTVQVGKSRLQFTPVRRQCGYYFIAPGRQPQVAYGVITDDDLVDAAQRYFGRP